MASRTMTRWSLPCAVLLLPGLVFCFGQLPNDKQKLKKELAKVEANIKREEARLAKLKPLLELEFNKLRDGSARAVLAKGLGDIVERHKAALTGSDRGSKREAERVIMREVKSLYRDKMGRHLSKLMVETLASNLADNPGAPALNVLNVSVEDVFPAKSFEENFEEIIKQDISLRLMKLRGRRDQLKRQIEEIDRQAKAASAGIPHGMVAVSGGKYGIGIDEKDILKVAELLQYGTRLESVLHLWRASPSQETEVEGFYIDRNEVTNAWYAEFLKDPANADARKPSWWKDDKGAPLGTFPEGWGDKPVTDLSHNDALRFARWMGRRLPTEFEWEAAARHGRNRKNLRFWPWGDEWSKTKPRCNNNIAFDNQLRRTIPHTMPPLLESGTFPDGKSQLGINDLAGNAFEITSSPWTPYAGFKTKKIGRVTLSSGDFNPDAIVIRGGDANKRDIVVSTVWRWGLGPTERAPYVGFRTAASVTRGKDHVRDLTGGDALKRWLVDCAPLSSDLLEKRQYAALDEENPAGYTSMTTGGWDAEKNLPTRAKRITVIRRKANDFRDFNAMKAEAKQAPLLLAYMYLDVPIVDPPLAPGTYLIQWRNTFIPVVEDPEGEPGEGAGDKKGEKGKPKPKPKPRGGKKKVKEPDPVPEAFLFQRLGGRRIEPVVLNTFLPPVVGANQPVRLTPRGDSEVQLTLSFPIKYQNRKAFIVTLSLKTEPGVAATLK